MYLGLVMMLVLGWAPAAPTPVRPPGRLVDVGGHRLHLLCKGGGRPTVILESGLAESWITWAKVHDDLAKTTRVCAYDRAGVAFSDPGPTPRTSSQIAGELHRLLHRAAIPAPYVLVAHSIGGYHARFYAHQYPTEVAGMVLIDSSHEDQARRYPSQLAAEEKATLLDLRTMAERAESGELKDPLVTVGGLRPEEERQLAAVASRPTWYRTLYEELGAAQASAAELRAVPRELSVPLTVIAAGRSRQPSSRPPDIQAQVIEAHRSMQADLVTLSTDGRFVASDDSGHYVQWDMPEVVLAAVTDMVNTVKRTSSKKSPNNEMQRTRPAQATQPRR